MVKLKYIVVFVALIAQPINFAEVANAQLTGSYSSPQGYRTYYSIPGAAYWHPIPTPRENNQVSSGANDQISLRQQRKNYCADKLKKEHGYTNFATLYESSPQYIEGLFSKCMKPYR